MTYKQLISLGLSTGIDYNKLFNFSDDYLAELNKIAKKTGGLKSFVHSLYPEKQTTQN